MRLSNSMRWISLIAIVLPFAIGASTASAASRPQQAASQICVKAFEDKNGNATLDAGESLLAGVTFQLIDASGVKATYTTDGASEPYCFGNLEAATYTVRARPPDGYESTGEGQFIYPLAANAEYDVTYGARQTGAAASSASDGSSASTDNTSSGASGGPSTLARIALGALGVIILLAAGFMAGTIVQRSRQP
jgi:hypothetical protein